MDISSTLISVGSGLEIFGLGLTILPYVQAQALSGLIKCVIFGLGLRGSGFSGLTLSGFNGLNVAYKFATKFILF